MKFIKKPIAIEAEQITQEWLDLVPKFHEILEGVWNQRDHVIIKTLEGDMRGDIGDWIITGVKGEKYPCKPDIFEKTYIGEDKIGEISDGYHTFNELYDHRITLYIALCEAIWGQEEYNNGIEMWRSKKHSDGELAFGGAWFVLGINKEKGEQITYHLPIEKWDECHFAEELEKAPEWDGHTSKDVLERLKSL